MAKTGLRRRNRAYLLEKELYCLSEEFAAAMRSANLSYVHLTGARTPRMFDIWARYVELAGEYEKTENA